MSVPATKTVEDRQTYEALLTNNAAAQQPVPRYGGIFLVGTDPSRNRRDKGPASLIRLRAHVVSAGEMFEIDIRRAREL